MSSIQVKNLKKFYRVHQKEPGLVGSIKSLVSRKYSLVKAVDGISFSIEKGELTGFIGPNGAGKTTTLKCLSGLLYPSGGFVEVLGFDPWERKHEFLRQISLVMGAKNQLWWDLPAMETFLLNKEIYEIPEDKFKKTLDKLVEILEVGDIVNVQVRKLSLGQRMKCELIAALLHSPKVLFLDEPTIGLDVVMQKKIRDFIRDYNQEFQATIILTSHYMVDVQSLAKRVIVINKGVIVFDGPLSEIIEKYADHKLLEITLGDQINLRRLAEMGEVKDYDYPRVVLKVKKSDSNAIAAKLLRSYPVEDLNITEVQVEEIIREMFTGKDYVRP